MKPKLSPGRKRFGRANASHATTYEVGYRKPPQAHQFKPGQSGNPRGRPKHTKNEATILRDLLNRRVEARGGGKARKITILEAILLRFAEEALKGNTKTAAFLLDRYADRPTAEAETNELSPSDREVLDHFVERIKRQLNRGKNHGQLR
jgi:Family of unknown function (DUF5681)